MTNENMFEVATRTKMRFPYKGVISVEDLWDLGLDALDSIFRTLNSQLKQVKEESLLNTRSKEDKELDVKIEIIKYIVRVILEEQELRLKAKNNREQKQKILEVLAMKQDQELLGKGKEELENMLNELS